MKKRAFTLLRVSGQGQTKRAGADQGYSIEMQRNECARKAEGLDAEIVDEWVAPAESASRGFYKTLTEMIGALKVRRDIDYVIVYKLERFARDELTDFAAYAEIKKAGAELVSATESIDGTPQGMLMHGILTAINAYYSRDLGQKITDGRLTKAKLGGTPGRARLGYLNVKRWDGQNDIRDIEIDPERAPHMQWAFQAMATGEWSTRALAERLYERGFRNRPHGKRAPGKVGPSTLHELLRDPYYIGIVTFRGVQYEGNHPKLVPPKLFDQVQQVLTAHRLSGDRSHKHGNYLKGTVYCGLCGRRLIFTKCKGRHGGQYDYFVCAGRHKEKTCPLPYIAADRLEHFVGLHYESQVKLLAKKLVELEPDLKKVFELLVGHQQREVVHRQKDVDDILGLRTQLVEKHFAKPEAIPLDVLEAKQIELGKQLEAAEEKVALAGGNLEMAGEGLKLARERLQRSSSTYGEVSRQTRRIWNQAFFKKIFVGMDGTTGAELTAEYAAMLSEDLPAQIKRALSNESRPDFGRGSNERGLVELRGLEPLTFALPARRSSS